MLPFSVKFIFAVIAQSAATDIPPSCLGGEHASACVNDEVSLLQSNLKVNQEAGAVQLKQEVNHKVDEDMVIQKNDARQPNQEVGKMIINGPTDLVEPEELDLLEPEELDAPELAPKPGEQTVKFPKSECYQEWRCNTKYCPGTSKTAKMGTYSIVDADKVSYGASPQDGHGGVFYTDEAGVDHWRVQKMEAIVDKTFDYCYETYVTDDDFAFKTGPREEPVDTFGFENVKPNIAIDCRWPYRSATMDAMTLTATVCSECKCWFNGDKNNWRQRHRGEAGYEVADTQGW